MRVSAYNINNKTVSAFSNYDGGKILFGIDDNGNIKGLPNIKQSCLDIENRINDSISPQPNYTLEIQNNDKTITLTVKSGTQKPYLYKSKAYKRNDTATIEVDTLEFSRLILEGQNIRFEELPCKDQKLSFQILCRKLKESIQIETFNQDTLRTLNLYDSVNGYNNATGLLTDKNHFSGIEIVKFGENISVIQRRETFENISVLDAYEKSLDVFRDYYQYEEIQGADRKRMEKIPKAAYREALANVFYRLGFVEIFGTGIIRIKQLYEEGLRKPDFEVSENTIRIVLSVFEKNLNLTEDEKTIYKILSRTMLKSISEIAPYVPFGKSKATQLLKDMGERVL